MNTISVELVPRSRESLSESVSTVRKFPAVGMINIPDLISCPIRSWEATSMAREFYPRAIPHIRAIDIDPANPERFFDRLRLANVAEVLLVSGDIPQTFSRKMYPTTVLQAIEWLKEHSPDITVYVGLDPYRSGMRKELSYLRDKISAGAEGLFTQPFFDLGLVGIWADILDGLKVYWGVAPVTTLRSKEGYWETKNNVVFPKKWNCHLSANQDFAREVIAWSRQSSDWHTYLMPIKIDIETYLSGVLE